MGNWPLKVGVSILVVGISSFLGFLLSDYLYINERFPSNCFVENIDVSLLTKREALKILRSSEIDKALSSKITLEGEGFKYEFRPSELGIYIQPLKTLKTVFDTAYEKNYLKGLYKRTTKRVEKLHFPLELGIERDKVKLLLEEIAKTIDLPSVEAKVILREEGKKFRITKEVIGRRVDIEGTIASLEASLDNHMRGAELIIKPLIPRVLAKDLIYHPPINLISQYRTYYGAHDSPNRIHNIKLGSKILDNYILLSGEILSLLPLFGEFDSGRGFKEAYVIIGGELAPQYGGGVCQIATTLYNAAMLVDLEILERKNHAIWFTIYPLGRDVGVYPGISDLKIKNSTPHPLMIKAAAGDKYLTFKIFGTRQKKRVLFSKPEITYKENETEVTTTEVDFSKIGRPFSTKVIKSVYIGDNLIKEEVIKSSYKLAGEKEFVKIREPEPIEQIKN